MFQRTTPARLTLIVLVLILGILLGLALLPSGEISGASLSGRCDAANGILSAGCLATEFTQGSAVTAQAQSQASFSPLTILLIIALIILAFAVLAIFLQRTWL